MSQQTPRFDPELLPVIGTGADLPRVPLERLRPDALREHFAAPPAWTPELIAERQMSDRPPARASVLVPLVLRDEPTLLLTRRTAHLRDHAGQISFPGGRAEPDDVDAADTALRETEEEIGLARSYVEVIGLLPEYTTVTNFIVTPVVGLVTPGFAPAPDPFEVDDVFEVPLAFILDPANHERRLIEWQGERREVFAMPWEDRLADGTVLRYFIWGATAAMLRNLYRCLIA
jgi:8-oxo-dGTP pyrophosphatase MutT (NUDIX family)